MHRHKAGHCPQPLRLRRLLSDVFLPIFVVGAVFFGVRADTGPGDTPGRDALVALAAVRAALVLPAADLPAVPRRLRREPGTGPAAR